MTTVLEKPPWVATDEKTQDQPKKWYLIKDTIKNKPWELLDKAANSPKFHTAAALGMMACWAYNTQANGHTKEMPSLLQHTIESGAHPVLGFIGAWLGYVAAKAATKWGERHEFKLAGKKNVQLATIGTFVIGGIAAGDFAGEMGQGIVTSTYFDFAHQKFESTKDAIAAAMGGVALGASNWREKRKIKSSFALSGEAKSE